MVVVGTAGALAATTRPGDDAAPSAQVAIRPGSISPTTTIGPPAATTVPATPVPTTITTHVHTGQGTTPTSLPPGMAATEGETTGEDDAATVVTPTTTSLPPDACTAEDLTIELEFTKPSYALGELITATGTITNTSERVCGPIRGHEAWFIDPATGSPLVLPLPVGYPCPAGADCSTPPGASREFPVCWTQVVMFGEPIEAGTYQVTIYGYLPGMVESFDLVITDTAPPATTVPFDCNPLRNGAMPSTSWKSIAAG